MNAPASPSLVDETAVADFTAKVHEAAAHAFDGVASPGHLTLMRIMPDGGRPNVFRFPIGNIAGMTAQAIADAKAGFNVYLEGRTVKPGTARGSRGTAFDTAGVFALVIDDDGDKGRSGNSRLTPP